MEVMIVAVSVLLLSALVLAAATIRHATQGTELRIVFRNGGRITTITVPNPESELFARVAGVVGVSSEEIAHEEQWLRWTMNVLRGIRLKTKTPPPDA